MNSELPPRPTTKGIEAEARSLLDEPDRPSHARISYTESDIIVGRTARWFASHPWVRKLGNALGVAALAAMATYGTCTVRSDAAASERIEGRIEALATAQKTDTETIVKRIEKIATDVTELDKESERYGSEIRVLRAQLEGQEHRINALDRQISGILRQQWITDQ
jgi:septal ring factor EnvC (AmiA/AmiB activator)